MNLNAAANNLWQSTLFTIFAWLVVKKILGAAQRLTEGPEIEALDRAGNREGLRRRIRCATTESVIEPGVHGVFRHVLLLPARVAERLSGEQLDAIIEHEMCHIRCYD